MKATLITDSIMQLIIMIIALHGDKGDGEEEKQEKNNEIEKRKK